jgi:hypothetical protein
MTHRYQDIRRFKAEAHFPLPKGGTEFVTYQLTPEDNGHQRTVHEPFQFGKRKTTGEPATGYGPPWSMAMQ